MKIAVLQTIAFGPPDMGTLPADVVAKTSEADLVLCVYQNSAGEAQATVMRGTTYTDEVEIFDVV